MSIRLDKPWQVLDAAHVAALPGMLGVYEIASPTGSVTKIGFAGGLAPFGLRTELERELVVAESGARFRVEINQQYRTRYCELLMVHLADHGCLPPNNDDDTNRLGRLSPG